MTEQETQVKKRRGRKSRGVSMNRCPDCNRFVGLEFQEPEEESLEYSEGEITMTVRLVLACADCGGELADHELELQGGVEHPKHTEDCECDESLLALDVESRNIEQAEDSKGYGRYMQHFYGARVEGVVRCPICEAEAEFALEDMVLASSFDVLV